MAENEARKLNAVVFGIRYQRKWHVLDITGEIIDDILRNEKSPFDDKYFTKVGDKQFGKEVANLDTGCLLKLNIDDLIFKHVIDEDVDILKSKDLDWFFNVITEYLIPEIILNNNFEQIIRVGIIYYFYIPKEDISIEIVEKLSEGVKGKTTKFSLDFHKKTGVDNALAHKDVNDYKNSIYFMRNKDDETFETGIDHQYYFKPFMDTIKDFNFEKFLGDSKTELEKSFCPWLSKNFKFLIKEVQEK